MNDLKIDYLKVDKLTYYANNSRTHSDEQVEQIVNSIKEFGFTNPILIDENNGVIAGHGRLMACDSANIKDVPCVRLKGLSEAQKKAYVIADNSLALNADWDIEQLQVEIENLKDLDFDFDVLGLDFEDKREKRLVGLIVGPDKHAISKTGDIWQLGGRHRLMCGDSTNADDVKKLINGENVDITFSSPPYNFDGSVSGGEGRAAKCYVNDINNKSDEEYREFLNAFTKNALDVSDYVFTNIQSLANNKVALIEHLYDMRDKFADTIIWDKGDNAIYAASHNKILKKRFEYVHVFSKSGKCGVGVKPFDTQINNLIEIQSLQDKAFSNIHRATFPTEFAQFFVDNFTTESCYDPFAGTGTTLIACEKSGRKNYSMELEETYCDLIIKRWQDYTGKKATHAETGLEFNE